MPYPILNTTPHTTTHPQLHNAWVDVMGHFGAVGDGIANDTVAIQNAIAATPVRGTVFFPPGYTFLIDLDSIVFTSQNIMAEGATFSVTQTGAGVAIDIGNGVSEFYDYTYRLGIVKYNGTGSGSSWQSGSVGVRTRGFYTSKLSVQQIYGFEKGLYMSAGANNSCDSAYGQVEFIDLVNNKVNLYIDAGTGNCFNNEISYFGARMGHSVGYGSNVTDCHHIKIAHTSNNYPNMHKFYNMSVESDTVEDYKTLKIQAANCLFWNFRFEASNPGVEFVDASSVRNWVMNQSGYTLTISGELGRNRVTQNGNYDMEVASAGYIGNHVMVNSSSTYAPVIVAKAADADPFDGSSTDYMLRLGAGYCEFKDNTDTNPRLLISNETGQMTWGSGSGAGDVSLDRSTTGILRVQGSIHATANHYITTGQSIYNISTGNNGQIISGDGTSGYGWYMTRNLADAHPVVYINQHHASATGPQLVLRNGGSGGVHVRTGTGSPESAVTAPVGSIYLRSDGSAGNTLYVKESGTGNTGWMKVTTSSP